MEFRDAIKYLRSDIGLTQLELATALHVNYTTISRWETGKFLPSRVVAAVVLDYAKKYPASERCIQMMEQTIADMAKNKRDTTNDALYCVEHASLRQLIDDVSFPIYVCDMETDDLLYANTGAAELIGSAVDELPGHKCYECIMHRDTPCDFCDKNELSEDHFSCQETLRLFDGVTYQVYGKLIQWNGRRAQVRYISQTDSGKQLKAIIENMHGGVSVVVYGDNDEVRLEYANDQYYQMLGYTRQQFEAEQRTPISILLSEDTMQVVSAIENVVLIGQSATYRCRATKKDGEIIYISCNSSISSVEGLGNRVLINIVSDVTAAVQVEQQALVFGQRLSAIMSNINNGVAATKLDDDGVVDYIFVSGRYYEMLGYTPEQYRQEVSDPYLLVYSEDAESVREETYALREPGQRKTLEFRVVRRDGAIIWLSVNMTMISFADTDQPVLLSVFSDITTIVHTKKQLEAQHNQISELLNDTPVGIAILEVDAADIAGSLHATYYNDIYCSYCGYSREEYAALTRDNEVFFVFEEDVAGLVADVEKACSGNIGDFVHSTVRCHTKDGGYCWLMLTGRLTQRRGSICYINVAQVDITERKEAEDKLRISEEMLRLATETDNRAIITYNVKTNTCHLESRSLASAMIDSKIGNIPESLIELQIIAPDSVAETRSLFSRIRSGEQKINVALQLLTGEREYQWFECNCATVFDANGQPDHAVLVFHNITEQRIKESIYKKWQQSIEKRAAESYTLFRCSLSKASSIDEQSGKLFKIEYGAEIESFNERTKIYAEQYVYPSDRDGYVSLLNSNALLAMFHRGEHVATLDYREINDNGSLSWRRLTVEMVEYPSSTDVQAFLMYEDIDEAKRAELKEKEMAETDPLTGLLNRIAFSDKVESIISSEGNAQHAMLMMDMDGFKQLNDSFGHAAGDQALQDIAAALRSLSREGDLVCRLGGDEFLVWLNDISYDAVIEKKARQICEQVRKAFSQNVRTSASIGIAVYPRDGHDFDELYHNADIALYKVKQAGKDSYAFISQGRYDDRAEDIDAATQDMPMPKLTSRPKRRLLIIEPCDSDRAVLEEAFRDEFLIETSRTGTDAMIRLRHFGSSVSVVLLDLATPGMDGFEVLKRMQRNAELRIIPVIVISANNDHETALHSIEYGAADFVNKPVDIDLIRIRVKSAVSRAENERLRAQNSYLQLQRDEELKFQTVLESTGTVVVEYNWRNHVFIYDNTISNHIAGNYNNRSLWTVFLTDMVADCADVKTLQDIMLALANAREQFKVSKLVMLKTPGGEKHWFRMNIFKQTDDFGLADKMLITFNDVHKEVLFNEKLRYQVTRDELTGLYNRTGFFEEAEKMIAAKDAGSYVMACMDIEKFKVINDQYGMDKGNEVLRGVAQVLSNLNGGEDMVCCRTSSDRFAVLYPASTMGETSLSKAHREAEAVVKSLPPLRIYIGRCLVNDKTLPITAIYDRAGLAKTSIKGRYDVNVATYDESMRTRLLRQQEITSQMKSALESGQFEVWLQPQFNHGTGLLSGAEALSRWRHPKEGIIFPTEFIPIFEKNGFIYDLDKFVWEQTCKLLRKWIDQGLQPVPVSVNISRYDVFRDDIINVITGLVTRFDLPRDLLRLEITESAFSEDAGQIIRVVEQFVELGFVVEIDDFGSGYSSLNTLKDVPAQVLKMDMHFLENDNNSQRGGSIIESVVRMAKWLNMSVIAEGVETIEQADYLKSIGCEHIQGHLYCCPTQVKEYEDFFTRGKIEPIMDRLHTEEVWNNNAFWDPKSMESLIFNSYVGGACIFEYHNGGMEMLRWNTEYDRIFSGNFSDDYSSPDKDAPSHLDKDDKMQLIENLKHAIESKAVSACEVCLTDASGIHKYIRSTVRQLAQTGERHLFYCVVNDITEQRMAEQKEQVVKKELEQMLQDMPGGFVKMLISDDKVIPVYYNDEFCRICGMSHEQVEQMYSGNAYSGVHPDDLPLIKTTIAQTVKNRSTVSLRVRLSSGNRGYIPMQVFYRVTQGADGRLYLYGYYADASEQGAHGGEALQ